MHKFFVSADMITADKITITGEDVNHISNVLRIKRNEQIQISDGSSMEYICTISEINKKNVICDITNSYVNKSEAPLEVTLYQGLPKAQKMDLIIQKCVEIGVKRIQPVISERVVVKLDGKEIKSKLERWNRISVEAAKQSSRGIIPQILEPVKLSNAFIMSKDNDINIIPYEKEYLNGIKNVLKQKSDINKVGIFIGPEGGFDEGEIENAISADIVPVTLGPRILRTETAGFTALAFVLYEIGDMGGISNR